MSSLSLGGTDLSIASFASLAPVNGDGVSSSPTQQIPGASLPLFPQQPTSDTVTNLLRAANSTDTINNFGSSEQGSAADFASSVIGNKLDAIDADGDGCKTAFKYGGAIIGGLVGGYGGSLLGGASGGDAGAVGGAIGGAMAGGAFGLGLGKELGSDICGGPDATPAAPTAPADGPSFTGDDGGCTANGTDQPAPTDPTGDPSDDVCLPDAPESAGPSPTPDGGMPADDDTSASSGPIGPRSDSMPADDSVAGGTPRSYGANTASFAAESAAGLQLLAFSHTQIA